MRRLGCFVANAERWLAGGALLLLAGLVCVQIVCRAFSLSISFTEEIARFILVWCVMLGAAAAVREGGHLSVECLSRFLPSRWGRWAPMVGLCVTAAFFVLVGVLGVRYAFSGGETSQSLRLPIWTLRLAIPVGAFLVAARCVEQGARIILRRQP